MVTWISHDLLFHDRKMGFVDRTRQVVAFLLKLATTSKGYQEMSPRVVTFETILKTDFAKFVLANSITLTPGTITMLIRGKVFHVHTMSQFLEDDLLTGSIEKKVAEVFEPEVLP